MERDEIADVRTYEEFLRRHGFSRREAVKLAAGGWGAMTRDTPDPEDDPDLLDAIRAAVDRL